MLLNLTRETKGEMNEMKRGIKKNGRRYESDGKNSQTSRNIPRTHENIITS